MRAERQQNNLPAHIITPYPRIQINPSAFPSCPVRPTIPDSSDSVVAQDEIIGSLLISLWIVLRDGAGIAVDYIESPVVLYPGIVRFLLFTSLNPGTPGNGY